MTLLELTKNFPELLTHHSGDLNTEISNPSDADLANERSIIFVQNPKYLQAALESNAAAVVIPQKTASSEISSKKVILTSKNPALAQSMVCLKHFPVTKNKVSYETSQIAESAFVHPTAKLGQSVTIQPNAVIGPNVVIDAHCLIGANSCIEADCVIGEGTHIHPQVFIGHSTVVGKNCDVILT